jgi:3'(2'), 5'-bisphosphate nucleotidase
VACDEILGYYHAPDFLNAIEAKNKADSSPVTAADLAADDILFRGLQQLQPAFAILTEERADQWPTGTPPETFWCVDPLDGTKGFVNRTNDFAVCIGLIHQGLAVAGIVAEPISGTVWAGNLWPELGDVGAWELGSSNRWKGIRVRKAEAIPTVVASRNHATPSEQVWLAQHLGIYDAHRFGSAVKFAWLATGKADCYLRLGTTSWWDVAAGEALVKAAGGRVSGLHNQPLEYRGRDFNVPGFLCTTTGLENLSI